MLRPRSSRAVVGTRAVCAAGSFAFDFISIAVIGCMSAHFMRMSQDAFPPWEQVVRQAFAELGNQPLHLVDLNRKVEALCRNGHGRPLTATWPATVRRTLQQSKFFVQDAKHSGVWRLATPADHAETAAE